MNDKLFIGIILGMLGGAVIATNSAKARKMIKDGQQQIKQKVDCMGGCCSEQNS